MCIYTGRMQTAQLPARPTSVEAGLATEGLRERKKRETRRAIHRAALEIARDHGVGQVTADAVAERAGISTRTFFNYFSSRDDALVGFDPELPGRLAAMVAARPAEESMATAVGAALGEHLAALERDPVSWDLRQQIAAEDPALGARMLGVGLRIDRAVVEACVERARSAAGRRRFDELAAAVEAYAVAGAIRAAVRAHLQDAQRTPLIDLVERAFATLPYPR